MKAQRNYPLAATGVARRFPAPKLNYQPPAPRKYRPRIGCGGITANHFAASRAAGWEVVALCDVNASAALKPFAPDVALIPINGNRPERRVAGNLNSRETAKLAKAIGARLAVPHHFDMFEFNTATPEEFEAEGRRLGQAFRTSANGERMEL